MVDTSYTTKMVSVVHEISEVVAHSIGARVSFIRHTLETDGSRLDKC